MKAMTKAKTRKKKMSAKQKANHRMFLKIDSLVGKKHNLKDSITVVAKNYRQSYEAVRRRYFRDKSKKKTKKKKSKKKLMGINISLILRRKQFWP